MDGYEHIPVMAGPQLNELSKIIFQFWDFLYAAIFSPSMFSVGVSKNALCWLTSADTTSFRVRPLSGEGGNSENCTIQKQS